VISQIEHKCGQKRDKHARNDQVYREEQRFAPDGDPEGDVDIE